MAVLGRFSVRRQAFDNPPASVNPVELPPPRRRYCARIDLWMEGIMGLGKAGLLWLIGIPLPIILVLMLIFHH
jgi:hypothetical protein